YVLLAPGDLQVAVLVDRSEVPCVEPSVLYRPEARGGLIVVALEDVRALDQDLPVLGDLYQLARKRPSNCSETVILDRRDRRRGGGLGHAVALEDGDPTGPEELEDLAGDRRGPARGVADATAEDRTDVFEERLLGLFEGLLKFLGDGLAAAHQVAYGRAELDHLLRTLALLGGLGFDRSVGERVGLLEDAGDR